ncbi:MAG TPA: MoaD/ThiS family protein [Saprospiraceae bacterium]|nr:MoaD/ThiS family protein [Saprospiraceae bacterium]
MKIILKYFGLIADITGKTEEVWTLEPDLSTSQKVIEKLQLEYLRLKEVDYSIAINQTIVSSETTLNDNDIIALLPPFAGG